MQSLYSACRLSMASICLALFIGGCSRHDAPVVLICLGMMAAAGAYPFLVYAFEELTKRPACFSSCALLYAPFVLIGFSLLHRAALVDMIVLSFLAILAPFAPLLLRSQPSSSDAGGGEGEPLPVPTLDDLPSTDEAPPSGPLPPPDRSVEWIM